MEVWPIRLQLSTGPCFMLSLNPQLTVADLRAEVARQVMLDFPEAGRVQCTSIRLGRYTLLSELRLVALRDERQEELFAELVRIEDESSEEETQAPDSDATTLGLPPGLREEGESPPQGRSTPMQAAAALPQGLQALLYPRPAGRAGRRREANPPGPRAEQTPLAAAARGGPQGDAEGSPSERQRTHQAPSTGRQRSKRERDRETASLPLAQEAPPGDGPGDGNAGVSPEPQADVAERPRKKKTTKKKRGKVHRPAAPGLLTTSGMEQQLAGGEEEAAEVEEGSHAASSARVEEGVEQRASPALQLSSDRQPSPQHQPEEELPWRPPYSSSGSEGHAQKASPRPRTAAEQGAHAPRAAPAPDPHPAQGATPPPTRPTASARPEDERRDQPAAVGGPPLALQLGDSSASVCQPHRPADQASAQAAAAAGAEGARSGSSCRLPAEQAAATAPAGAAGAASGGQPCSSKEEDEKEEEEKNGMQSGSRQRAAAAGSAGDAGAASVRQASRSRVEGEEEEGNSVRSVSRQRAAATDSAGAAGAVSVRQASRSEEEKEEEEEGNSMRSGSSRRLPAEQAAVAGSAGVSGAASEGQCSRSEEEEGEEEAAGTSAQASEQPQKRVEALEAVSGGQSLGTSAALHTQQDTHGSREPRRVPAQQQEPQSGAESRREGPDLETEGEGSGEGTAGEGESDSSEEEGSGAAAAAAADDRGDEIAESDGETEQQQGRSAAASPGRLGAAPPMSLGDMLRLRYRRQAARTEPAGSASIRQLQGTKAGVNKPSARGVPTPKAKQRPSKPAFQQQQPGQQSPQGGVKAQQTSPAAPRLDALPNTPSKQKLRYIREKIRDYVNAERQAVGLKPLSQMSYSQAPPTWWPIPEWGRHALDKLSTAELCYNAMRLHSEGAA